MPHPLVPEPPRPAPATTVLVGEASSLSRGFTARSRVRQTIGTIGNVGTKVNQTIQKTTGGANAALEDVVGYVGTRMDSSMPMPTLIARLLIPQVFMAGWVGFVYWVCFDQVPSPSSAGQATLTIGPGCIPAPQAVHPNGTTWETNQHALGPVVTPANFADLLAPQNVKDTKETQAPIFVWHANATTIDSSSEPSSEVFCAPNTARESCNMRYVGGELFLAISPALLHSVSYGLMKADEHELTLELSPGWERCMPPLTGNRGVSRLDQLLGWLMHQAGRAGGFVAHSPDTLDGELAWSTLDLSQCNEFLAPKNALGSGACQLSSYQPSVQIKLFLALETLTVFVVLIEVYTAWMKAKDRLSSDTVQHLSNLLLPVASLSSTQTKRNRAAAIARHVRSQIRDRYLVQQLEKMLQATSDSDEIVQLVSEAESSEQAAQQTQWERLKLEIEDMHKVQQIQDQIDASDAEEKDLSRLHRDLLVARERRDAIRQEFWRKAENQRCFADEVPFLVEKYIVSVPSIVRRQEQQQIVVSISRENVATHARVSRRNVHYPVILETKLNVQLKPAEFFEFLYPSLVEVNRELELQGKMVGGNAGCGRLLAMLCNGENAWERKICNDIFDMIDVDGSNQISFDELERYLLYFRADGADSKIVDLDSRDEENHKSDEATELPQVDFELMSDDQVNSLELMECMIESDLDQAATNPGGINMAADMIWGGPVKVREHWVTIVLAGVAQALLVFLPVVCPLASLWLRNTYPAKADLELYFSERFPVLGRQADMQRLIFFAAVVYTGVAMANNMLYIASQYMGLQPKVSGGEDKARAQMLRKKRVWALKAAVAWVFKVLLLFWTLFTLWGLTQFAILLVVAIVVDPYRPFMIICVLGTVIGYAKIALSSAKSLRQKLKQEIQTRFLKKHRHKLAMPAQRKKTMARMNQLIAVELDSLGLSFRGIVTSVVLGTLGVSLVLAVVLLAQGLFYSSVGTDPSSLISTLTPCAALLANKLSSEASEKIHLQERLDGVEATVTDSIEEADKGETAMQKVQQNAG